MPIPARILRAFADDLPGARHRPSPREQEREDRIIAAATTLMARFGAGALTLASFAVAMRMSPATIRRHFPDTESLLAEIIFRHLKAITDAIGQASFAKDFDRANPQAARRAAYLLATRTAFNAPTEAHLLLVRERHALPPGLADPIEQLRLGIGDMLAGNLAEIALSLLDTPYLQAPQIEAMLATITPAPIVEPASPPAPHLHLVASTAIQVRPAPVAPLPPGPARRGKIHPRNGPH